PRRRSLLIPIAGGIVALLLVLAIFFGRPLVDRLTGGRASGTPTPTANTATSPAARTTTPANKTTTAPASAQPADRPSRVPAAWKLVVDRPAGQVWHNQDESEGGRCSIEGQDLHVTRPASNGLTGCTIYD